MKKLCITIALTLLSTSLYAIDLKLEREKLQTEYLHFQPYPIMIVDQDEISWRYLQAGLMDFQDREQSRARAEIFGQYILEVTGVSLTAQQLSGIEVYTTILKDGAFAVPVLERMSFTNVKYQMCMVFTSSENSNQRLEHERLLGLNDAQIYGDTTFDQLEYKLPYETLALFSLYHELAHCLDQTFMPEMYNGQEDAHTVHLAENFAEGLAALMLHQIGIKNITRTRGFHRILYSRMMGRHFAQNPNLGFGHPFFAKAGVIYHLEPGLRGAETFATLNRNRMNQLQVPDLIEAMKNIVNQLALNSRSFHAIGLYLADENPIAVIDGFRERAFETPHWFYGAYRDLLEYHDYTTYVLERMFNPTLQSPPFEDDLAPVSIEALCQSVLSQDQETFEELIKKERLALRASKADPLALRQRAVDLNTLELKLFLTCKADLAQF